MKTGNLSNPFAITSSDETVQARRDALTAAIMPPPVYRGTFSRVVALSIVALGVPSIIVIDTGRGDVAVAAGTSTLSNGVAGALSGLGDVVERRLEPSDAAARSAGITVKTAAGVITSSGISTPEDQLAFDAALDASLGAQDTAKSLASLADAVADAIASLGKALLDGITANSTLAVFHVEPDPATVGLGFFSL